MNRRSSSDSREAAKRPTPKQSPETVEALHKALEDCPPAGTAPATNPWRRLLYNRLRDRARPSLVHDGAITPAASLWTGARLWTDAFRAANLRSGDRVVIALPPSVAFIQVLVAALWEGATVALTTPQEDSEELLSTLDARAAVAPKPGNHTWEADEHQGPASSPTSLRDATRDRTPDVRFLLRTSGTTQHARWIALSDQNVLSVLASHLPHLALKDARPLSVLPWSHAFGLVLDLFPSLLSGAEIIRDPEGGRGASSLVDLASDWNPTHLSAVPLTIERLMADERGAALLKDLHGGIVGGAPISGPLSDALRQTRLRVGYGQTEASPGITLGPPGTWAANYLGRPVGCSVELAEDGELVFEGPNACVGVWRESGLKRLDPDRTVHTGDLARREGDDLFFRGRKDQAFKLSNGRLVRANALEARIKSDHPSLRDAMVFTPDGESVAVALCAEASTPEVPSKEDLRSTLGSLGTKLTSRILIPPADWPMESKGTVDRTEMARTLQEEGRLS